MALSGHFLEAGTGGAPPARRRGRQAPWRSGAEVRGRGDGGSGHGLRGSCPPLCGGEREGDASRRHLGASPAASGLGQGVRLGALSAILSAISAIPLSLPCVTWQRGGLSFSLSWGGMAVSRNALAGGMSGMAGQGLHREGPGAEFAATQIPYVGQRWRCLESHTKSAFIRAVGHG